MQLEPRNTSLRAPCAVRRVDDVRLDLQIVANEVDRPRVVRVDAADTCRRQQHILPASRTP